MYDSKYCKVLTIAYCNIQYEDGTTQTLLREDLNFPMIENEVSNVNIKGLMVDNGHTN